jgi:Zn-dependent protease
VVRPSPLFLGILAVAIAGGVLTALADDPNGTLVIAGTFLLVIGGWATSLCLHEFGHAIVAFRGGDREVYFKGYLTLDPRRYTDPVLSLLLPLLILAVGGIPLPGGAVWINHHVLRNRRVESLVSLAGPLSNLALGIGLIASVAIFFDSDTLFFGESPLANGLSCLALLQIMAFVLNILPIPGLDGFGAIEPYLSYRARELGAKARPWAPLVLFAVLIGIPGASEVFFDVVINLFDVIGGDGPSAGEGFRTFMFWQ